jgi:hypothetical protein
MLVGYKRKSNKSNNIAIVETNDYLEAMGTVVETFGRNEIERVFALVSDNTKKEPKLKLIG